MPPRSATEWTVALEDEIAKAALDVGFATSGVAAVPEKAAATDDARRFAAWVESGHAGEMNYLKRQDGDGRYLRSGLQVAMPWARSILVCAFNYDSTAPHSLDPPPSGTGWIARYAQAGRKPNPASADQTLLPVDYHDDLLGRLHKLETALLAIAPAATTRCYVDTGPILERNFAAYAGVGWIGKNTCVLNERLGSWLLLGVIVTSLPVIREAVALPAPDRCGSCTRCIDACPTQALLPPATAAAMRQMDASRCIAYLTIEKKGAIPEELREPMGRNVFGCDICQDVCPWNGKHSLSVSTQHSGCLEPRPSLINPELAMLGSLDPRDFKQRFKGTPLERTGRKRLLRNVAIAMGNSRDPQHLSQLQAWAAQTNPDLVLREAAQWALTQHATPAGAQR